MELPSATTAFLFVISIIVAVQTAAVSSRRPRLDGRIVGGKPIDITEIPFQVSLQRNFHFCGGSLIAKHFVLTAAHCTAGSAANQIKVRIGSTFSVSGGVLASVKQVHRHVKYNPTNIDYDFSILELEDYDARNVLSGFIKLPAQNEKIPDGTKMIVSGWGNTQDSNESRDALRAVIVPKVNQRKCSRAYAQFGDITDRMICAGLPEGGKDACQGDSGGPMVHNDTLVGVVSWGFGCAKPKYPGVYARVAAVRDWIKSVSGV